MQLYQMALILLVLAGMLVAIVVLTLRSQRSGAKRTAAPAPSESAAPMAEADPAPAKTERRRKLRSVSEEEAAAAAEPAAAEETSFSAGILARLEQHFEPYHAGQISLARYGALVLAEQQAVERHMAELRTEAAGDEAMADAEAAREAVDWCLEWAYERAQAEKRLTANS